MGNELITIDGSQGEGGGQILRTSVGLAAALGLGVRIAGIRARRAVGGLRPQHLAAVQAAAAICDARVEGAKVGASEISFAAGAVRCGQYDFDIGTAGSAALVLQTVLPGLICCEGDSRVTVTGGTHNPMAPSFEYLRDVFAVLAEATGAQVYLEMERPGFYPAGGGRVRMEVRGGGGRDGLSPLRYINRGDLRRVEGLSGAGSQLPPHIVHRQAQHAARCLGEAGIKADIRQESWETFSPGTTVFLRAVYSRTVAGFVALGQRGKPAERVADDAVAALLAFEAAGGALDVHAADQLVTLAALCPGQSRFTCHHVTDHLTTNAAVVRQLTGREVAIVADNRGTATVTVE